MGLNDFILNCERDNKELRKDIEYYKNKNQRLQQENQELKKQLEKCSKINIADHKYASKCEDKVITMENQQKEFIEYLEDRIKFWKDKIFENAITESDWTLMLWRNKLGILEKNLSKYKKIIENNEDIKEFNKLRKGNK